MIPSRRTTALAGLSALSIAACAPPAPPPKAPAIDQATVCEVDTWRRDAVAAKCTPGQKVVFLPASWGNEQLPVVFAAINCDLHFHVAPTHGAVTCIYQPISPTPAKDATPPPAPPKS